LNKTGNTGKETISSGGFMIRFLGANPSATGVVTPLYFQNLSRERAIPLILAVIKRWLISSQKLGIPHHELFVKSHYSSFYPQKIYQKRDVYSILRILGDSGKTPSVFNVA